MPSRLIALAFTLAILFPHAARAAEVATYRIEVSECPGLDTREANGNTRAHHGFGNGFVVKSFVDGTARPLLVTALHVVYTCTDIRVERIRCEDGVGSPGDEWNIGLKNTVYLWPTMDLAAIELTDRDVQQMGIGEDVGVLDFDTAQFHTLAAKRVPGL